MQKAKRRNKKGKAMGRMVMGIKRELIEKDFEDGLEGSQEKSGEVGWTE